MTILPATDDALRQAIEILKKGGVVAHATETCYGFACDLSNKEAVLRLFSLKKRPLHLPVSALFATVDDAKRYVEWNEEADALARQHLPGPLTLILPLKKKSPTPVFAVPIGSDTLGVRLSSHPFAQRLVAAFGRPLSTTSANIHSKPNPYSAQSILEAFKEEQVQPDLILDSGELPINPPSTVMDLLKQGDVLRTGAVLPS